MFNSLDRWCQLLPQHFGPLVQPANLLADVLLPEVATYGTAEREALRDFAAYIVDFLARPKAQLGRPGPVCPFVPIALQKGTIRLTAINRPLKGQEELAHAVDSLLNVFCAMPPESGDRVAGDAIYKALVVVLNRLSPDIAPTIVEAVQKNLKPRYIRNGLMIGEFYPSCPTPGLHSPVFRPLAAPIASLAIRHITVFDAPFMTERDEYILGYLDRFGDQGRSRLATVMQKMEIDPLRMGQIQRLIAK